MRAKVKVSVNETNQEYLLLVAKMNLKGILVHTSQILKPNTQLSLELKLDEQEPIFITGFVHKISEQPAVKKGMVIAFSNLSTEARGRIQKFIDLFREMSDERRPEITAGEKKKGIFSFKKKGKPIEPPTAPDQEPIRQDKTIIVGEDDLPSLSLSSPDTHKELRPATFDEESVHAGSPGLAGSTRHVRIDTKRVAAKKKKKLVRLSMVYWAMGCVAFVVFVVLLSKPILGFMDKTFGKKPAGVINPNVSTTATDDSKTAIGSSELDAIQVDDQGSFLKISLVGKGNFANNQISKLTDQGRIHIQLLDIADTKALPTTAVNNNPVSKIEVKKDKNVTVDIVCIGSTLPNFEAKVYPNSIDIFIYR